MTDEIKVGSRVRHETGGDGTVVSNPTVLVAWDNENGGRIATLRDKLTLIPDTVTVCVELTHDELVDKSREPTWAESLCINFPSHLAENKFATACKKALDEREGK
jgi:hypothetical protein